MKRDVNEICAVIVLYYRSKDYAGSTISFVHRAHDLVNAVLHGVPERPGYFT